MMKRIACLLVAVSLLGLSACTAAPATESPAPTATPIQSTAPTPSETPVQASDEKHFETTLEEVIDVLSVNIQDFVSVTPKDLTPDVSEWDASGNTTDGSYYSYPILEGVTLNLIDSSATGKIQSISLLAAYDSMPTDSIRNLGNYVFTLIAMFEPLDEYLPAVEDELGIAEVDFSKDSFSMATGSISEFTLMISDGVFMLTIDPRA